MSRPALGAHGAACRGPGEQARQRQEQGRTAPGARPDREGACAEPSLRPLVVIMQSRHPGLPLRVSRRAELVPRHAGTGTLWSTWRSTGSSDNLRTGPGDVALQIADCVLQRRAIVAHLSVYGSLAGRRPARERATTTHGTVSRCTTRAAATNVAAAYFTPRHDIGAPLMPALELTAPGDAVADEQSSRASQHHLRGPADMPRTPTRSRRAWPPCSPHRRQPCSPAPTGLPIVDALAQLRPLPSATPAVSGS